MDKDRIAGAAKEAKGAAKQAIGKATGDAKLQTDGKADKAEGKIQNAIGGVQGLCARRAEEVMNAPAPPGRSRPAGRSVDFDIRKTRHDQILCSRA